MLMKDILVDFTRKVQARKTSEAKAHKKMDKLQEEIDELTKQITQKKEQISKIHIKMGQEERYSYNDELLQPIAKGLSERLNRDVRVFAKGWRHQICLMDRSHPEDILALTINTRGFENLQKLYYDTKGLDIYCTILATNEARVDPAKVLPEDWDEVIKLLQPIKRDYRFFSLHDFGEAMVKLHNSWTVFQERPESDLITFRMPWQDTQMYRSEEEAKAESIGFDDQGQVLCNYNVREMANELRTVTKYQ